MVTQRWAELETIIRGQIHRTGRVKFSESLTVYDIQLAALNGMSTETNYVLPPLPLPIALLAPSIREQIAERGVPADASVVILGQNPVLFAHCLQSAIVYGVVSAADAAQMAKCGIVSVAPKALIQHLELLQSTARELRDHFDSYQEPVAELIALDAVRRLRSNGNILGSSAPMLEILGAHADGIMFRGHRSDISIAQRLAPGATVFIPGAGFNSLQNLNVMANCPSYNFVLNDRDPLVDPILRRTVAVLGLPNVSFISGDMVDAVAKVPRIDAVLAGNLYSSGPDILAEFCQKLRHVLPPGTPIHVHQTDAKGEGVQSTGRTWATALQGAGLLIEQEQRALSLSPAIAPELPQCHLITLSGDEVYRVLKDAQLSVGQPRTYATYLQARTPWSNAAN